MKFFSQDNFIQKQITRRSISLFIPDIQSNLLTLSSKIKGKSVLVIGGAGTIGSSFIKAILPFEPVQLIVVDYSENELTELTRDLRSEYNKFIPRDFITYPFDFGGEIFKKMFKEHSFDIVACFAAHKHVRSEKDHLAIEAMIRNNVFNTNSLLELCKQNPPEHFFSVSTDKAANPVNVMGASKKLMEKVLMSYTNDFKISTARFANVAFSNGSLLDGFNNRIMKRQPLSAPKDVKRYFVSPIESGELCLLACIIGETRDVFFPKLDESQMMTFSKIAELYLAELGLQPDYCNSEKDAREKAAKWSPQNIKYPVYFFKSDTSGEKPYEEFYSAQDVIEMSSFETLGVIKNDHINSHIEVDLMLREFDLLFSRDKIEKVDIVNLLSRHIPDFNHLETGMNLDQKL